MCCSKRRNAQYGGAYGAGCGYYGRRRQPAILTLIEGVQQMRLASQQRALEAATMTRAAPLPAELGTQTQGTIFDHFDSYDEKKQMPAAEAVNFEVLPTYEEVAKNETPRDTVGTHQIASATPIEAAYVPTSVSQSLTSRGLNLGDFNAALTSYREGDCCGKGRARRAAKNLVRELASQEIASLQATNGPMTHKQRKQVLRDLEPIGAALKNVVREIRRE